MHDDPIAHSYDETPYDELAHATTHPAATAGIATLYGLAPPPVERCRVLELGCAHGANLLPMAVSLPGARFVGIDLSPRQIAAGVEAVAAAGLGNVELHAADIQTVDDRLGTFDYVIVHGVYSWVPPRVQDRLLAVCAERLSPDGVAYVSYNTYPGWHVRQMVREMMRFHDARQPTAGAPAERVAAARELLEFVMAAAPTHESVYGALLQEEAETIRRQTDSHLLHEQLEAWNEPLYLHQFVARAASHGLRFVGEARISDSSVLLSEDARRTLAAWTDDRISREQYVDFLTNRTFRRTLLCHADRAPADAPLAEAIERVLLVAHAEPATPEPVVHDASTVAFVTPDGVRVSTNDPVVKAMLLALRARHPAALPFGDLCARIESTLAAHPGSGAERLAAGGRPLLRQLALRCVASGLADVLAAEPRCAAAAGDRPAVSPAARLQAARGARIVTNLRHLGVELSPLDRQLLPLLDGTRDRPALLAALEAGGAMPALAELARELGVEPAAALDLMLTRVARQALLVAA